MGCGAHKKNGKILSYFAIIFTYKGYVCQYFYNLETCCILSFSNLLISCLISFLSRSIIKKSSETFTVH